MMIKTSGNSYVSAFQHVYVEFIQMLWISGGIGKKHLTEDKS